MSDADTQVFTQVAPYRAPLKKRIDLLFKRIIDFSIAAGGLVFLFPLFILIAILIKKETPGPVLYRGRRVGRGKREFFILKFRTMHDRPESYNGPRITVSGDPRITPLGKWLRETKLNELPQLWNVLKGEMSLVGPRPEDPDFVAQWPASASNEILSLRPGVTSPASILYREEEKLLSTLGGTDNYLRKILPDKLRLDRLYVRNRTLLSDMDVLFWTMVALLPPLRKASIPEGVLFQGPLSKFFRRYMSWFVTDTLVALAATGLVGTTWRARGPLHLGLDVAFGVAIAVALFFGMINSFMGLGRVSWRHARPSYAFDLLFSSGLAVGLILLLTNFIPGAPRLPVAMVFEIGLVAFLGFLAVRYRERLITGLASRWLYYRARHTSLGERVLIVGAGECGMLAAWLIQKSSLSAAFKIVGMVDDDLRKQELNIDGYPVLGRTEDIPRLVAEQDIGLIMFAISAIDTPEQERILGICRETTARLVIIPDILQILDEHLAPQITQGNYGILEQ